MGGALTLAAACAPELCNEIDAVSCFYGIPRQFGEKYQPPAIRARLQLNFGLKDTSKDFSDPTAVKKLVAKLCDARVSFELHWYDADHAFMNETGPRFDKRCADQGFKNMTELFNKAL